MLKQQRFTRMEKIAYLAAQPLIFCLTIVVMNLLYKPALPQATNIPAPARIVATASPAPAAAPIAAPDQIASTSHSGGTIEYTVYGDSGAVEIAYVNGGGAVDGVEGPDLPWSRPQYMSSGRKVMVTARNVTTDATLACEISIDGIVVKHVSSSGEGALAICSAVVP